MDALLQKPGMSRARMFVSLMLTTLFSEYAHHVWSR
jgi:hypothetical protein